MAKPNKNPLLSIDRERKPQIGYQSHIFDRINNLAAASPYRSRNEFLDACVQILDDMEKFTLKNELSGLFKRDEILLLGGLLKLHEIRFYPDPRYKSLLRTSVEDLISLKRYDKGLYFDQAELTEKLASLTEFQTYVLIITVRRAFEDRRQFDLCLFEAFNPKDFGYLILAKSHISVFNAARMAGRDLEKEDYILGKRYSIEDAEKLVQFFETRDREAGLYKEDLYVIFNINDS